MDCGVRLQDIDMRFFQADQEFHKENIIFYFPIIFRKKCVSEIQKSAFSEKSAIFKMIKFDFKFFLEKNFNKMLAIFIFLAYRQSSWLSGMSSFLKIDLKL